MICRKIFTVEQFRRNGRVTVAPNLQITISKPLESHRANQGPGKSTASNIRVCSAPRSKEPSRPSSAYPPILIRWLRSVEDMIYMNYMDICVLKTINLFCGAFAFFLVGTLVRTSVAANIQQYSPLPERQKVVPPIIDGTEATPLTSKNESPETTPLSEVGLLRNSSPTGESECGTDWLRWLDYAGAVYSAGKRSPADSYPRRSHHHRFTTSGRDEYVLRRTKSFRQRLSGSTTGFRSLKAEPTGTMEASLAPFPIRETSTGWRHQRQPSSS
ncbi:hypothetical protein T4A_2015 [Trichinella pseudospiralis]|uniref:Uncharacterized protein n=1 Tax=Trichinella pseudospiralis TaxID=6337 RepID=A0A0V1EJ48_TRIPS|nr:hypothetical protein T4A_2015 [Trichinella pseudospiralis]